MSFHKLYIYATFIGSWALTELSHQDYNFQLEQDLDIKNISAIFIGRATNWIGFIGTSSHWKSLNTTEDKNNKENKDNNNNNNYVKRNKRNMGAAAQCS